MSSSRGDARGHPGVPGLEGCAVSQDLRREWQVPGGGAAGAERSVVAQAEGWPGGWARDEAGTRPPARRSGLPAHHGAVAKEQFPRTRGRNSFLRQTQTEAQMLVSSSAASFSGAPTVQPTAHRAWLGGEGRRHPARRGPHSRGAAGPVGSSRGPRGATATHTPSSSHFLRILVCANVVLCSQRLREQLRHFQTVARGDRGGSRRSVYNLKPWPSCPSPAGRGIGAPSRRTCWPRSEKPASSSRPRRRSLQAPPAGAACAPGSLLASGPPSSGSPTGRPHTQRANVLLDTRPGVFWFRCRRNSPLLPLSLWPLGTRVKDGPQQRLSCSVSRAGNS